MTTLGLKSEDDIQCDLAESTPTLTKHYDTVVHAAGDITAERAMSVNFDGTRRICEALEKDSPCEMVYISSLSVYGLSEGENIDESTPLNPTTLYGKSKLKAEEFLTEWCDKHSVRLSILRPALIVGTGMKGTLGTMVRGINAGYYFHIKGNEARRSVVHAYDVARAARLIAPIGGTYNLADGVHPTVHDLAEAIAHRLGDKRISTISQRMVKIAARIGDIVGIIPFSSARLAQLTKTLTVNTAAIERAIDWKQRDVVDFLLTHEYDENDL